MIFNHKKNNHYPGVAVAKDAPVYKTRPFLTRPNRPQNGIGNYCGRDWSCRN